MRGSSLAFFFLLSLLGKGKAQVPRTFQWGFNDASQSVSPLLPQCQSLAILALSLSNNQSEHGVPPYYMMALEPGGTPTTTFMGTNASNLTWTPGYDINTTLILAVADSTGSTGGVTNTMTVTNGQGSSCYSHPKNTSMKLYANVTKDLQTCQPLGLQVVGGVSPYTITLMSANSPDVTNVTMPKGYDVFTYINRADPNGQLLAAVSDSAGQWGTSPMFVNTKGSTDTACTGLSSQVGQSSQIPFYGNGTTLNGTDTRSGQDNTNPHSGGMSSRRVLIIAICAAVGGLVLLGLALYFGGRAWTHRKYLRQDTTPRTYNPPLLLDGRPEPGAWGADLFSVGSTSAASSSGPNTWQLQNSLSKLPLSDQNVTNLQYQYTGLNMSSPTMGSGRHHGHQLSGSSSNSVPQTEDTPFRPESLFAQGNERIPPSLFSFSQPPPSLPTEINYPNTGNPARAFHYPPSSPTSSSEYRGPPSPTAVINRFSNPYPNDTPQTARSKQAEARLRTVRSSPTTPLSSVPSAPDNSGARPSSHSGVQPLSPSAVVDGTQPDIIIQHRDGGTVTELPPPYMDRGSQS